MMEARVEMLRGTGLGGGIDAHPGEVISLPAAQADALVRQGRARYVTTETTAPAAPAAVATSRKGKKNA